MKFLKVIVKNFKPYLDETVIPLYTPSNADTPITAIVGPNGTGKTSICDAVLWAIYGKEQKKDLSKYTNNIAKQLTEAKKEKLVPVSVKLDLEIDGKNYQIVRNSAFNIQTKIEEEHKVTVIRDGNPIGDGADSDDWLRKNFPVIDVIKYYIFSAEEMLDDFETRQEEAVKDHINVITGITALAGVEKCLTSIIEKYEDEKSSIRRSMKGFDVAKYDEAKRQMSLKQEAIKTINGEIQQLEGDKTKLFPQGLSNTDKEIKDSFEELNKLGQESKKIEEDFLPESNPSSSLPNAHFIFLKEIITKCITANSNAPISKADWDSATAIIKSVLDGKFSGVLIESNKIELIDRTANIPQEKLADDSKLTLAAVASNQTDSMSLFQTQKSLADNHINNISNPIVSFLAKRNRQIEIRNNLKTLGQSLNNQTIVGNIDNFLALEEQIASKSRNKIEIKSELDDFIKVKNEMEAKQQLTADKQKDYDIIDDKITEVSEIQAVFKKTDDAFSNELIAKVTEQATKIFMGIIKDSEKRYSGIKITNKYEIQVLDKNGDPMDKEDQVSKGTLEIALFCFLLSLPSYVQANIPYFVDNPFMRLDTGNERRLLEQFVGLDRQIIMNLIPGREYSQNNFDKWLGKRINTQNYIEIEDDIKYNTNGKLHTIQNYPAGKVIAYRDEDL